MSGNAGGAKDPDFRCASQDGEVAVIGDEPGNTINDRTCRRLLYQGVKDRKHAAQNPLAVWLLVRVLHGEADRKAGCGKSARPV